MNATYKCLFSLLTFSCLSNYDIHAQERIRENWEIFYSSYEWVPGTVNVNMQLINSTPKEEMPFVLITGAQYTNCTIDGFPLTEEYQHLNALSDSIVALLSSLTTAEITGTFTCQCKRTDYIYVKDTTGLRLKLYELFNRSFKQYTPLLWIKPDPTWSAYRTFLYPTEEKLTLVANEKRATELMAQGDIITKPRPVDHWLNFATKKERKEFIAYAIEQQFKIIDTKKIKNNDKRFQLQMQRSDLVEPAHLTHIIMELKLKAREMNGEYGDWDCGIVKE